MRFCDFIKLKASRPKKKQNLTSQIRYYHLVKVLKTDYWNLLKRIKDNVLPETHFIGNKDTGRVYTQEEIFIRFMPKYGYNKRIIMLRKFVRLGIFARVELMGDSFYLVNPAVVCNGGTLNVLVWEIFNLTNLTKKYNFREKVQNDERIVALWKEIYNG